MALCYLEAARSFRPVGSVDSDPLAHAFRIQCGWIFAIHQELVCYDCMVSTTDRESSQGTIFGNPPGISLPSARSVLNFWQLIKENKNSEPDVSYWLIEDARRNGFTETDWNWLSGDAVLAVVAGRRVGLQAFSFDKTYFNSDTITSTLICLFYRLASDPARTEKLHAEVAAIDCSDDKNLQKLPYLTGVLNEALRLHPALLTGGYRKTPKEGAVICGRFVPGETTIVAPRYTIFRRGLRPTATAFPHAYTSDRRGLLRESRLIYSREMV